ncbi:MAG: sensor histidine kinase [Sporichthyaceae bacterium]|nr:sensor histidine kinase [Sporichthyaceae bacterium]
MALPQPPITPPWWRSRSDRGQLVADTLLALGVAVADLVPRLDSSGTAGTRPLGVTGVLLIVLPAIALLWRRSQPLPVLVVACACVLALQVRDYAEHPSVFLSLLAASYAAGAYARSRAAIITAVLVLLGYVATVHLTTPAAPRHVDEAIGLASILVGTFVLGRSLGLGRAYTAQLEQRATDLARTREAELRGVVADERSRIARELHDVVAHHVSVMTVQAAAARRQLDRDPERSADAMAAVESTGRTALAEMRHIVGVLRDPDEAATGPDDAETRAPQPGLAELPALIAQIGEAGLPAAMRVVGQPRPLSAGLDLAAYRIVQEALTNTLRHAGPTTAEVLIQYTNRELVVQVSDRGHGLAAGLDSRGQPATRPLGHGVLGMRERVGVYGGQLYAGPRAGGGFEVLARIPIESVSA